jgi:hypothetical protein
MKVSERVCAEDYRIDGVAERVCQTYDERERFYRAHNDGVEPVTFTLHRGEKYTVSPPHGDGTVTVFSRFWVRVPERLFYTDTPGGDC